MILHHLINEDSRIVFVDDGNTDQTWEMIKMPSTIARYFTGQCIPSPAGKKNWQPSSVESILTNEKYKGDAILQKTFCVDFLTKKMKVNEGEIPQYYVENSHPAIIEPEVFDLVQHELKKRKTAGYSSKGGCFSSRIICGECGAFYGSKVWHSTDKYRRTVWQCNRKFKNDERCQTPHIEEETIKSAFVNVMNGLINNKDSVIEDYRNIINRITDTTLLDDEEVKLKSESEVTLDLIRKKVNENAHSVLDQDEYQRGYDELVTRYEAVKTKLNHISEQRLERSARREKLTEAITMILEQQDGLLDGFNESLWNATVESVTVKSKDELIFTFKDETVVG